MTLCSRESSRVVKCKVESLASRWYLKPGVGKTADIPDFLQKKKKKINVSTLMSLLHYNEMSTELGWLCLDFFPLIATPQTCNTITEDSCIHQAQRRKMIFGLERTSYLISPLFYYTGFPSGTMVKSACQCRRQETPVWSLGQEESLDEEMATHSSIFAWKTPWTERSLAGNHPWGCKMSDVTK